MVSIAPAAAVAAVHPSKASPRPPKSPASGRRRSRHETDMDEGEVSAAAVPGKRARVAFDPEVRVQVVAEWEKGLDLIRHEVRHAIGQHKLGETAAWDGLKEVFLADPSEESAPSPATLKNHLLALSGFVSLLDKSCAGLVRAVLRTTWLPRDDGFVAAYVRFLGGLVSAQGSHVGPVLRMLVDHFADLPPLTRKLPSYPVLRRGQLYGRAHMALRYLLHVIPSASNALSSVVVARYPHPSDSKRSHVDYVENLLHLVGYAPELRSEVMALITDRLLKIDVQVQVDLDELDEEVGDLLAEDISPGAGRGPHRDGALDEGDEGDEDEDDGASSTSEDSADEEGQRLRQVRCNIEKIDVIMDRLFAFYAPCYRQADGGEGQNAFRILLNHFAAIVLPTYRSRHTQFLLFHFAQTSPALIDEFVGACAHFVFEEGRPALLQQSAAAYLASFVARGAHVPAQVVQDVFYVLGDHLDAIRLKEEAACAGPDMRRYGTFYAMVQALLYIFCFRWRDLLARPRRDEGEDVDGDGDGEEAADELDDGADLVWAPRIKELLTRNLYARLNPLKVCAPSIVHEFARIAHHLRFMYIFPILETNKRLRLTQAASAERHTALTARKDESCRQLDAYFPFDPYHLPISRRWVEGDYVEWRGIPGLDDGRDHDEADTDDEDGAGVGTDDDDDDDDHPGSELDEN